MHSTSAASTPSSSVDIPSQPAPRPKRLSLGHFRKLSQPAPRKERSASAYEAWIDNALIQAHSPDPTPEEPSSMARGRSSTTPNGDARKHQAQPSGDVSSNLEGHAKDEMPTIKLIPHQDPRSNRPSLAFPPTARTLPHEDCVIRVGRYSERDTNPNLSSNAPSASPIGFKSKVVSRRHCEFWCSRGQWYIKDVKSSSGTFLNHIRLSQPSIESKPFPVNDGDVVQLGIDFRGGEEMIFRCVKIRVECNRGWQKTLNSYKYAFPSYRNQRHANSCVAYRPISDFVISARRSPKTQMQLRRTLLRNARFVCFLSQYVFYRLFYCVTSPTDDLSPANLYL